MSTNQPAQRTLREDCVHRFPCAAATECCLRHGQMQALSQHDCQQCRGYQPPVRA